MNTKQPKPSAIQAIAFFVIFAIGFIVGGLIMVSSGEREKKLEQLVAVDTQIIDAFNSADTVSAANILTQKGRERRVLLQELKK